MITQDYKHPLKEFSVNLRQANSQVMLEHFERSWDLEEALFKSLTDEQTFFENPDPLRNPLIFYLGHSAVFYINKLIRVGLLKQRINPEYEVLFEIGVDPSSPEELEAATRSIQWPQVQDVWDYRSQAKEAIANSIQATSYKQTIDQRHPLWAILMGIEHSCIHFETSSMLIRQLPLDQLQTPKDWKYASRGAEKPQINMVRVSGGVVTLGKSLDDEFYGWDVDYGLKEVTVPAFSLGSNLVTNQEFLEFVLSGGYENPESWDAVSWQWKMSTHASTPKFWQVSHHTDGAAPSVQYRAMFDEFDLPLDWPAEVNHYEAQAFCRWKGEGYRLLSEAEWRRALEVYGHNTLNVNFQYGSPTPVKFEPGEEVYDLRGNVWEWLNNTFAPLPGYEPHYLYEDYSQPFFDDQHYLMVGGSWASTGSFASAQCRNWFRPYFHQHVGFRLARDAT